jgi:RNA polymerase sigma-70 factor (ECF subfamily)
METDPEIRRHLDAGRFDEAFTLVVEAFKDRLFRLALSMLRSPALAEEATQEVFMKVWKALPAYHGGASLSTWIYTIMRNTCLTELRKQAIRPTVSLQDPALELVTDTIPALQSLDPESGVGMDVALMLDELPAHYREGITLFYLEQKSYEEAAVMLGIPVGTFKTLLFRARRQLLRIASRHAKPNAFPSVPPARAGVDGRPLASSRSRNDPRCEGLDPDSPWLAPWPVLRVGPAPGPAPGTP